jgi:putative DNA primase/helicase
VSGGRNRSFDPSKDMPKLESELARIKPALLIVDPIVSAVAGDSHKSTEVRRGLQPLVDACANVDCALLGITHLSKGTMARDPTERVTGSIAFAALPRIVILCAKTEAPEGEKSKRMFVRSKSNIGSDSGGFEYDVTSEHVPGYAGLFASVSSWGSSINTTARDALGQADNPADEGDTSAQDEAADFLRAELADGEPRPSKDLEKAAKECGISLRTLRRAQQSLRIKPKKIGTKWCWKLPVSERLKVSLENQVGQVVQDIEAGQVGRVGRVEIPKVQQCSTAFNPTMAEKPLGQVEIKREVICL